jgi:glycosyltransferase involved in cell wall biosynthesis
MEQEHPFISIVIPTYNRPERLADCLRSCSRLDYPPERFEVIVVDDGGVESLAEAIEQVRGAIKVTLLRQENAGPATARNTGARAAKGEFLVFTDDDCSPAQDWLAVLATRFKASPDCAIGGHTANALTGNFYATATQLLVSYLIAYYAEKPGSLRFFPSSNLGFPTARFRAEGGFNGSFPRSAGEDREMCDRWQQKGLRMIHAPEAVVDHSHHLTARTFVRQHFLYGTGAYHFYRHRSSQRGESIKVEPPSFYLNMLVYPFGEASFGTAMRVLPLLIVAQAVNALGFFWEYARRRKKMAGSAASSY